MLQQESACPSDRDASGKVRSLANWLCASRSHRGDVTRKTSAMTLAKLIHMAERHLSH